MENLIKYDENEHSQEIIYQGQPLGSPPQSSSNLFNSIRRYWRITLVVFIVACAVGLPVIWLGIGPQYEAIARISVESNIPSVIYGNDSSMPVKAYESFKNDQVRIIMEDKRVWQRAADLLADKDLSFFKNNTGLFGGADSDPVDILRKAVIDEKIEIYSLSASSFIDIKMTGSDRQECLQIVDAVNKAYMAVAGSESASENDKELNELEDMRKQYEQKRKQQREALYELAGEYGTVKLNPRQEMMLTRVAVLQDLVTKIESEKILLETKIAVLDKTKDQNILPQGLVERRQEFVQNDLVTRTLSQRIAELEEELISAQQVVKEGNPVLQRRQQLLESFKNNLEKHKQRLGEKFDNSITDEMQRNREYELREAQANLQTLIARKQILEERMKQEDIDTIELGRKQLEIENAQEDLAFTDEVYNDIRARINQREVETKRPARISIPYEATVVPAPDIRIQITAVVLFVALACGAGLAIIRDKVDSSVYTPNDLTKRIGVRIIGTTTKPRGVKRSLLPQKVAEDYQAILANLGLIGVSGIPKKLVVTSPGIRDGKTTFVINLASSLAKAGKNVLLIDGDLREPDIHWLLNIPGKTPGLSDVLYNGDGSLKKVIHRVDSKGFDVITAGSKDIKDNFKLLSIANIGSNLEDIGSGYDHIIIDTPPVLGFSDALLWAKLSDGVILTSFAGQTQRQDIIDTIERLKQADIEILGTVLNSVPTENSYSRYSYYYSQRQARERTPYKKRKNILLLPGNNQ
ncbi:MAG: polysaccharide biosynthesis tyrosine autokinase [Sedimentisphaerales bacterium]|nr:polysaccharide biosynthesis tyrosine autokinase [Sedimentisphaerales bacterium]